MIKRLTTRIISLSVIWIILTLLATMLLIAWLYRDHIEQHYDAHVFTHVEELVAAVSVDPEGQVKLLRQPTDPRFYRPKSGWYWQVTVGGELLAHSESLEDRVLDVTHLNFDENHDVQILVEPNGQNLRARVVHMSYMDIPEPVTVLATSPEIQVEDDVADFNTHLTLSFILLAVGLSLAVVLQVGVALNSLKAISASISEVKAGHIDRLPKDFPLDVQPLADELNSLLDNNETMLKRARNQLADLAHLVNTPLTVIRNEARNIPSKPGQLILDQAHAMSGNIDHYLTRARISGRDSGFGNSASLKAVVEDVRFAVERMYRDRDIKIKLCNKGNCRFRGEVQDLEEMVGNLLDNACKHAEKNVHVSCRREHDRMTISIDDDGPGIPEEELKGVLKRGKKLDETTPGYGQGLGIVSDIAAVYGGKLTLGRSELGGLLAELELPSVI